MQFWEGNCFCGERKCEKHPNKQTKFVIFGGGVKISPPKGPEKTQPETAITFTSTSKLQ